MPPLCATCRVNLLSFGAEIIVRSGMGRLSGEGPMRGIKLAFGLHARRTHTDPTRLRVIKDRRTPWIEICRHPRPRRPRCDAPQHRNVRSTETCVRHRATRCDRESVYGPWCARLLNRLKRPLSRGSSPAGYPTEPLVSYQINRQLSGWNLPPLVIRAFGAHGHSRRSDHFWSTPI